MMNQTAGAPPVASTTPATTAAQNYTERKWPFFLLPPVIVLCAGVVFIVSYRVIRSFLKRTERRCFCFLRRSKDRRTDDVESAKNGRRSLSLATQEAFIDGLFGPVLEDEGLEAAGKSGKRTSKKNLMGRVILTCEELLSAQTPAGILLAVLYCVLSMASLVVYFVDIGEFPAMEIERSSQTPSDLIDLICNIFFFIHFLFRFVSSNDKLRCWIQLSSMVDMFTVIPLAVGLYLRRRWLGIRFVSAMRLMTFADVLQFLRVLQSANHIRLTEMVFSFLCIWITSSGFVHLVENSGDFAQGYGNAHPMTFGDCLYFIIITMSTVGYGDFYCTTAAGKIFSILFIFGAVALFASYVPEIMEIVNSSRQNYLSEYKKEIGFRHIIVGGHVSLRTVKNFVRDFTHDDRTKNNLKGIFLTASDLTLDIENVFKQFYTRLVLVKGNMMNAADLRRVRLANAEAVLILSDHMTSSPDSDDTDNIMRAVAVKNFRPDCRVILQLIRVENKIICSNLSIWSDGDSIICFNEMKMGYMAAGCLAPGFSTFLTNLVFMISHDGSSKLRSWQEDYMKGAEMEVYTEKFSTFFYGRPLPDVVEFCYIRLRLLLVAVSGASDKNNNNVSDHVIVLNAGPELRVSSQTIGFFLCPSEDDCRCVRHYCLACHCDIPPAAIRPCSCASTHIYKSLLSAEMCGLGDIRSRSARAGTNRMMFQLDNFEENSTTAVAEQQQQQRHQQQQQQQQDGDEDDELIEHSIPMVFDQSGSAEKGEGQEKREEEEEPGERFDVTGYFYWCPKKTFEESLLDELTALSNHIILCFSESSQGSLRNFILPLRASCFGYSGLRTIVVVGSDESKLRDEWPSVAHLPKVFVKVGCPTNRGFLRSIQVEACHMCVILSSAATAQTHPLGSGVSLANDNGALLATLNIYNMASPQTSTTATTNRRLDSATLRLLYSQSYERQCSAMSVVTHSGSNSTIPILTELTNDENVHLLSDNFLDAFAPFHFNQPFACGKTFAPRVIDALTPMIFFSPATYKLIKMFINWTDSEEHDQLLAEGILDGECQMPPEKLEGVRDRCFIDLLPLHKGPLEPYADSTFEHLLVNALQQHRILCMGLYRFIGIYSKTSVTDDRFVITNPPADFKLDKTDLVYCLCPRKMS